MKIYTKTGDDSTTFHGGARVSKSDLIIHCQGDIDELNSWVGMAARDFKHEIRSIHENPRSMPSVITTIQYKLFDIGAELNNGEQRITELDIRFLESSIDTMEKDLPELKNFILPRNSIHVARAVCRRAERSLSELKRLKDDSKPDNIIPYLNRLSDFLFVLARYVALTLKENDNIWDGKKRD